MIRLVEAIRLARNIKAAGPRKFTQHMVPHVVRPAQIIWNKALGSVFLLIAFWCFASAWNYYKSSPNPIGFFFTTFFGLVMSIFGITSWMRARRLSRL